MIRNIIFDMGQVLIRFNTGVFLDRFASDCTPEERTLLLREVYLSAEWIIPGNLIQPKLVSFFVIHIRILSLPSTEHCGRKALTATSNLQSRALNGYVYIIITIL